VSLAVPVVTTPNPATSVQFNVICVEQVTQCIVDSTKILGYITVEYYRLYCSNILLSRIP
jgi:hypothetical protein